MESILEKEFDLVNLGCCGRVDLVVRKATETKNLLPLNTLPFGLPPLLPDHSAKLKEFLLHPEKLPIHSFERSQKHWVPEKNPSSLFHSQMSPVQTGLQVERNPTSGELLGFKEVLLEDTGNTAKNSMSLLRAPCAPAEAIRGSSTNFPFWPGGMDEPDIETLQTRTNIEELDFTNLLSTPPGFATGMMFDKKVRDSHLTRDSQEKKANVLTLNDLFSADDDIFEEEDEDEEESEEGEESEEEKNEAEEIQSETLKISQSEQLEEVISKPSIPVINISVKPQQSVILLKEEWVVNINPDTPVPDFHKRIPNMAFKYPFELDTFQKQAILHMENHESVFVAAHTSAGKTVVAEYAIALSAKHKTRSVYTSPIKALSNQKFREFKTTFGDVGLLTGDIQIKSDASCLIMTTEILRSMLYKGSEVIRDLEWVIFDEVHYVNDAERGVVWEEVLILLPHHVNLVLLSATVPNTIEFAGWIGQTKKKKIYVISTSKRPVPLEHFLYVGSGKAQEEKFLVVDSKNGFSTKGFYAAQTAKSEKMQKSGGYRGPAQDKSMWMALIKNLEKQDQLPVVAFTFSRKRCEENANNLRSIDLTTAAEKGKMHKFFTDCISRLKGTDKNLPQVKHMQELLKQGVGVHHSGILPILKEVVEMLFQKGLVKLLFATETFAMGVNMPARTVIFDSIRKHDGTNFRDLLTGEYIQMAGRAGRRGLDSTGTVIILCKNNFPELSDLHKMMMGKPTKLESKFRLTYTMILNILRIEQIMRVEDIMKKSFSEFHVQKNMEPLKRKLEDLKNKEKIAIKVDCNACEHDLEEFYYANKEFQNLRVEVQKRILLHPQSVKPGRLVVVNTECHNNVLGIILQWKEKTYTTLVICEQKEEEDDDESMKTTKVSEPKITLKGPLFNANLFLPEGTCSHEVVDLKAEDIIAVTTKVLKINADKIIDNWKKRQQPRFRHDPPNPATSAVTQELLRLTESNPTGLPTLHPINDLNLRDTNIVESFQKLLAKQNLFKNFQCLNCAHFKPHFDQLSSILAFKDEKEEIQFLMSDESLHLRTEYLQRIEVLKKLGFIDDHSTVQLKGRVACDISNHELIITELLFQNICTNLPAEEIAALLSCMVFEQKTSVELNLTESLKEGVVKIKNIATKIGVCQKECGMTEAVEDFVEKFNFGLVEVVYRWAQGTPFVEIMELTDVQEGIIVRTIQRLDEMCRDIRNAAKVIGDPLLAQKMESASTLIKRDIVFAASLYTT